MGKNKEEEKPLKMYKDSSLFLTREIGKQGLNTIFGKVVIPKKIIEKANSEVNFGSLLKPKNTNITAIKYDIPRRIK